MVEFSPMTLKHLVVVVISAGATYLGYCGVLSSDAVAGLFGAILMYVLKNGNGYYKKKNKEVS